MVGIGDDWDIDKAVLDARSQGHDSLSVNFKLSGDHPVFKERNLKFIEGLGEDALDFLKNFKGLSSVIEQVKPGESAIDFLQRMRDEGFHYYAVFDGNQAKSADDFTYSDSGNQIPLSERFNAESRDIRYAKGGTAESQYDTQTAQRDENIFEDIRRTMLGRTHEVKSDDQTINAVMDRI